MSSGKRKSEMKTSGSAKKRKELILQDRMEVIRLNEKENKSQRAIADIFEVSKTQIQHTLVNTEDWKKAFEEGKSKEIQRLTGEKAK